MISVHKFRLSAAAMVLAAGYCSVALGADFPYSRQPPPAPEGTGQNPSNNQLQRPDQSNTQVMFGSTDKIRGMEVFNSQHES